MPFSIEKLPDAPIMLVTHQSKRAMQDMPQILEEFRAAIDAEPKPVFVVMDIRGLEIGLEEIPQAASLAALKPDALLHHPKIRESLLVSNNNLFKLGAQGLRSATFGNVKIRMFETPEQAIAYCHEQLTGEADQPSVQSGAA